MAEWFSASDLCSDGRVIRITAASMVLVSLSLAIIASLHPGVQMGTCEGRDGNCV